jgi:hypothetical protein
MVFTGRIIVDVIFPEENDNICRRIPAMRNSGG